MLVIGIILTIVGGIMTAWGKNQQNSWEYGVAKAFGSSSDTAGIDIVFYLGLLLLIVGIILFIIAVVKKVATAKTGYTPPKNSNLINPTNVIPRQMTKCANCGADMDNSMTFCPNCGSPRQVESATNQPRFCHSCGAQLNAGEGFCHECGSKVE